MSAFRGIVNDLRERRLWPIAVVLVIGLVAVPVLLARSAKSVPVPPPPAAGLPTALPTQGPIVSAGTAPDKSRLHGRSRDPFIQQGGKQPVGTAQASTSTPASGSTGSTTSGTSSTGSSGSTTGGTTGVTGGSTGGTTGGTGGGTGGGTTPTPTPQPTPEGLTSTQAYDVSIAITNSSGGFDTIDPFERLRVLPSQARPLLIELGVLKGGNSVVFVVQPGTQVSGPGTCTPGPIDCSILTVPQNKTENVGVVTSTGIKPVTQFTVTGISATDYSSKAEADKVRKTESAFGRQLLSHSTAAALSLFQYDASVGAVIDLRNLTVGGS